VLLLGARLSSPSCHSCIFEFTVPCFRYPTIDALLTGTSAFFDGTNCTVTLLVIIGLLSRSGWSFLVDNKGKLKKDEFGENSQFCTPVS
jgi:hypothetical protein